jgi:hypothetical protein
MPELWLIRGKAALGESERYKSQTWAERRPWVVVWWLFASIMDLLSSRN